MSKTPEMDALIARHGRETDALKGEPAMPWGDKRAHVVRQIGELIEHARSLESRLAAANARIAELTHGIVAAIEAIDAARKEKTEVHYFNVAQPRKDSQ